MYVRVDGHAECLQLTSTDAAFPLSLECEAGMGARGSGAAAGMHRAAPQVRRPAPALCPVK